MDNLLLIIEIVALLCVSVLCVYLVVVLVRVRKLVTSMEHDLKEVSGHAIPVLSNLEFITNRFRTVAQAVEDQVDLVKGSLQAVKAAADDVLMLERRIQERIEEPLVEAAAFVAALYRGIRTFFDRINK